MKTTVQELKELYAKLGGTADLSNVQTDSGMIDAIDSVAGGGGSLSPATADTLGGVKIGEGISVTEDGTISAGEEVFNVTSSIVDDYATLNKTFSEIKAAFLAGKKVVIDYLIPDSGSQCEGQGIVTSVETLTYEGDPPDIVYVIYTPPYDWTTDSINGNSRFGKR